MHNDGANETSRLEPLEKTSSERAGLDATDSDHTMGGSGRMQGRQILVVADDRHTVDGVGRLRLDESDYLDFVHTSGRVEDHSSVASGSDEDQADHLANDTTVFTTNLDCFR